MDDLDALYATTKAAIAEGRIGQPVFLRWFAHAMPDDLALREAAAVAFHFAAGWLGGPARRVLAMGGSEAGQITVSLEFAGSQRAVVAVSAATDGPCSLEWFLIGNRGSLRFGGEMPRRATHCTPEEGMPSLWSAILESLSTGQPADVVEEGKP
jgi:hypothetical protein